MRKVSTWVSLLLTVFLIGCAKETTYVRLDGQRGSTDPVLAQQFEIDAAICKGEMQKANVSGVTFTGGGIAGAVAAAERSNAVGQVAQGCMAQRGYALVQKDQAETKLTEFAAIAEEKKRRELATQSAAIPIPTKKKHSAAATVN